MMMFWEKEDRAIGKLLRGRIRNLGAALPPCQGFDTDRAAAYLEHSLSSTETESFELHLFECSPCRAKIAGLAALSAAETVGINRHAGLRADVAKSRRSPRTDFLGVGAFALLRRLAKPQWAIVAAAVVVVAVSVPLLVARKSALPEPAQTLPGAARPATNEAVAPRGPESAPYSDPQASEAIADAAQPASASRLKSAGKADEPAADQPASTTATAPTGSAAKEKTAAQPVLAAADAERREQSSADKKTNVDAALARNEPEKAAPPPPASAPAAKDDQLGRVDPKEALKLPAEDKSRAEVTELKPGRADGAVPGKDAAIKPDDAGPPSQPATSSLRDRRGVAKAARSEAFRDEKGAEAGRNRGLPERKIARKKFVFVNETWVDSDYHADKKLPEIPVIRDSAVFNDMLDKHSGLRPLFAGFAATERALIVYKGVVYKLIPQEGKK